MAAGRRGRRTGCVRADYPFGGCPTARRAARIQRVMILLELAVLGLTLLAFAVFDAYTRACERI